MARPPRLNIEGGIYHVMNRGNRKQQIFRDDRDRRRFLEILIEEKEAHGVLILGDCQMGNHFHGIVGTPHGNLSEFMCRLEGRFAQYSNWRHGNVGHLFQGRFRSVLIQHDIHLLVALCYVFLNPVNAGIVAKPERYKWSSFAATVGKSSLPKHLSIDWLTTLFPGPIRESQRRLRKLMTDGDPVAAYTQADINPHVVRRILRSYVGDQLRLAMLPRTYRSVLRLPLSGLVRPNMPASFRAAAIYEARVVHGYTYSDIARAMRVCPATVSKIFRSISASRTK